MSKYIITEGVDLHKRYFVYNSLDRRDGEEKEGKVYPVSYTHLTLPTICSV